MRRLPDDLDPLSDARCLQCRYLLKGLEVPRCPECGMLFDPADVRARLLPRKRFFINWQSVISLILIVPPFCVPSSSKMAGSEMLVPAFVSMGLGFGIAFSGVRRGVGWNRWFCALTLIAHAFIIYSMAKYLTRHW